MSMTEFVERKIEKYFRSNLFTSITARIVSVENYEQDCMVDVQPCIADIWPEDNAVMVFPVILNVPVILPSGGGAVISVPLKVGDFVQLEFSMKNMENWLEGDTEDFSVPQDSRTFHIKDAVAKPCIYQRTDNPNPNPNDLELRFQNTVVRHTEDGNYTISTDGDVVIEKATNIYITNSGNTVINTSGSTEVNVDGNVDVNSGGNAKVSSGGTVTLDASNTIVTGNLRVDGGVNVGNDVQTDVGVSLNTHAHIGNLGSPTSPPMV